MTNSEHSFAVGMVVYSPPVDMFPRLEMLSNEGFTIYIYDNSPEKPITRRCVRGLKNVKYSTSGKNVGLGIGLSTVCAEAYSDSFEAMLFFDQDTVFDLRTIEFIGNFLREAKSQLEMKYTAVVFASGTPLGCTDQTNPIEDVMLAISSGSLFFLENLRSIGWHSEEYFVDGVDYEFCLRSLISGFKIGRCINTPGFDHISGQPDVVVKVLGKMLPIRRYSRARIADAAKSYGGLLFSSLRMGQFRFAMQILRASGIYIFGQMLARMVLK
jgi:rhamnosyltransferase